MPRSHRGTTSQAGYGPEHKRAARTLKAAMVDGDLCCRCGQPMYRWQLDLARNDPLGIDADHHDLARVLGGQLPDALAHRSCNRRAGAQLGNALRRSRRTVELPVW